MVRQWYVCQCVCVCRTEYFMPYKRTPCTPEHGYLRVRACLWCLVFRLPLHHVLMVFHCNILRALWSCWQPVISRTTAANWFGTLFWCPVSSDSYFQGVPNTIGMTRNGVIFHSARLRAYITIDRVCLSVHTIVPLGSILSHFTLVILRRTHTKPGVSTANAKYILSYKPKVFSNK